MLARTALSSGLATNSHATAKLKLNRCSQVCHAFFGFGNKGKGKDKDDDVPIVDPFVIPPPTRGSQYNKNKKLDDGGPGFGGNDGFGGMGGSGRGKPEQCTSHV